MQTLFSELLSFFGISELVPTNFSEFFPWFLAVLLGLGLFMFVFNMIRSFITYMPKWTKF